MPSNTQLMNENDIVALIKSDDWMMRILHAAAELNLPDWMIGAGFVRNKVWDYLHNNQTPHNEDSDIDLAYFDLADISEESEKKYDEILKQKINANWSAKNQARMATLTNDSYASTTEAVSNWVETATTVAVKIENNTLVLIAPHGIDDLVNLVIRPVPSFADKLDQLRKRIEKKKWLTKWPRLTVGF